MSIFDHPLKYHPYYSSSKKDENSINYEFILVDVDKEDLSLHFADGKLYMNINNDHVKEKFMFKLYDSDRIDKSSDTMKAVLKNGVLTVSFKRRDPFKQYNQILLE